MARLSQIASGLDMYRKVPVDLMEGTKRGSILSYLALFTMVTLFLLETSAFFSSRIVKDIFLDDNEDSRIRLNFNITMLDLKCEWAVVDVVSVLGTDQNVTANVNKYALDANGVRRNYKGRNRNQVDIELFDESVTASLEELHHNGEDAVSLDEETLKYARMDNEYLFVDFYASWCSHCRDLAPTWETLAELMTDAGEKLGKAHPEDYTDEEFEEAKKVELPVMIAKIDCVSHPHVCNVQEHIRAYPTLRLFVDGERWKGGDYRGHRTVLEMVEWLLWVEEQHKTNMDDDERTLQIAHEAARKRLLEGDESDEAKHWADQMARQKSRKHNIWKDSEHPGCQLTGHLMVDRVPGNFHIQARSQSQEFAAHMTNVSHMVGSLYVGDPITRRLIEDGRAKSIPPDVIPKLSPMDGNVYRTLDLHESYHHYIKLISTQVKGFKVAARDVRMYQMIENSQLAYYRNDMIPSARFVYDLSPIAVSYRHSSRHWYDYCTSIMAIIGGVFTVVGMLEAGIHTTVNRINKRRYK